ncbi:TIGR00282 family metallophosphoesterase [bacterium]|jgi:2',3'-cyclic-nucleotide 2'-phosphodiesterase|nr:TIGR00282 family metallophosphoesterase [bacterium]MBT4121945.1 TIGR00282 family metallophosphoesterase [bacterium]MBT4334912.1 TIGR00282 family metallophosphoesterase [bacterium]MBT4495827.1 TIGR00282 family metallophosphoesterase [bacterium]MBT4763704.1 TIGR00282 family metallophosphoesterase [bacterium]
MKILFFGDIEGKIGRLGLTEVLPQLKEKYQPDITIANAENLAHGKGVTASTLTSMKEIGIDLFTSGNHVWKKADVKESVKESKTTLITPANDPRTADGDGYKVIDIKGEKLLVINLLGRVFMHEDGLRCPFKEVDEILKKHDTKHILVDIHAEATSEKVAMGWYLDGKASMVIGTHTHVSTDDLKKLHKGTGYITDIGMVGPTDSVIGIDKDIIIDKFINDSHTAFEIPKSGEVEVNGLFIELDKKGKIEKIEKIYKTVII